MVRELLDRETASAQKGLGSQISRTNYDFVVLRQETFGVVPEHVDARTFRIRRIEPSFWIKDIHITLQFADMNGMWIPHFF
jgi:hypothetical protein